MLPLRPESLFKINIFSPKCLTLFQFPISHLDFSRLQGNTLRPSLTLLSPSLISPSLIYNVLCLCPSLCIPGACSLVPCPAHPPAAPAVPCPARSLIHCHSLSSYNSLSLSTLQVPFHAHPLLSVYISDSSPPQLSQSCFLYPGFSALSPTQCHLTGRTLPYLPELVAYDVCCSNPQT